VWSSTTDDFRFRKFVKSIPKDDVKYAAIVAGLP
jgi:hypothetical protein